MGRNLTNLYISQSFEYLVQLSGSELQNGLGSTLTGSLLITASKADTATSASFATTASYVASVVSASYAVSSSFSSTSTSASYALTSTSSSFATNANSASYATTSTSASFATNATSASYALTASYALNGGGGTVNTGSLLVTASITNATTTYTKGDGSTFALTTNNVVNANSASVATSASYALSASQAQNSVSASFATTASYVASVVSASYATNALSSSYAVSASQAQNAVSASYAPTNTTGSFTGSFTGSLLGTASYSNASLSASYAATATSSSYAINATSASYAVNSTSASYALSASQAQNAVSASYAPATSPFPFTGSARITGSLIVTGSSNADNTSIIEWTTLSGNEWGYLTKYNAGAAVLSGRPNSVLSLGVVGGGQEQLISLGAGGAVGFYGFATDGNSPYNFFNSAAGATFRKPLTISSSLSLSGSLYDSNNSTGSSGQVLSSNASGRLEWTAAGGSINTGSFATTGSNTFIGNETISGSLNVSGSVTGNVIGNNTDTYTSSAAVQQIVTLTQAEYNAIGTPNANTLYIISGSTPINTSIFATTGSNTFVGNQTITGSLAVTSTGSFNGFVVLSQVSSSLDFADDTAAAAGGVPLGGLYRSGNFILIRLT